MTVAGTAWAHHPCQEIGHVPHPSQIAGHRWQPGRGQPVRPQWLRPGRAGDRLTAGLSGIVERLGLPYVVYNQGSVVHLQTSGVLLLNVRNPIQLLREVNPRKHMMEEMGAAYMAHGLVTLAGSRLYTSAMDTDELVDEALNRFEDVFKLAV